MKRTVLSILLAFLAVGGMARADDSIEKATKPHHVLSQVGDRDDTKDQVYIYSKQELKEAKFSTDNGKSWFFMTPSPRQGDFFIFTTGKLPEVKEGQQLLVHGLLKNGGLFTDRLTTKKKKGDPKALAVVAEGVSEASPEANLRSHNPELTMNEIYNGAPDLEPQTVAQARVNYSASTGYDASTQGHFGSAGTLQTTAGSLSEGWGMGGSPDCYTCHGDGACYADASCFDPIHGMYQRIRFYVGGTHP